MRIFLAFLALIFPFIARADLGPENLLLVVNKNHPEGQPLAEYYAQQRHVPDGRIVALDLQMFDDVTFDNYENNVVAPLQQFLKDHHLESQVKCIVLFWGVPLRVVSRIKDDPQDKAEMLVLQDQMTRTVRLATPMVEGVEKLAEKADLKFTPLDTRGMDQSDEIPRRAEYAVQRLLAGLQQMPAGPARDELAQQSAVYSEQFRAPVLLDEQSLAIKGAASQPTTTPTTIPSDPQELNDRLRDLSSRRWDPVARRDLRALMRHSGVLPYTRMLQAQVAYFQTEDSQASVDNELALLWWNYYPRVRWQPNPLCYKYLNQPAGQTNPTLMVMRLDAPKPEQVKAMIDTSIKIEATGLTGNVVLDARGIPAQDPANRNKDAGFGLYDQTIRNLAMLLRARTKLPVQLDDLPALLPPNSAKDVAIYCGWYSPGKYVPCVSLVPGAVAFHIGSFELTTLRQATFGWCKNLIEAGAVGTLGPESEPYLHSFPAADDFFALLLTGKLTLAEVYWRSNPLTSWRQIMIGDPLYSPFKTNPQLKVEDLPPRLQPLFSK